MGTDYANMTPDELRAEVTRLREADDESAVTLGMLSGLLTGTANALKGPPPELVWHDWSDLPALAGQIVAERDRLMRLVTAIHIAIETVRMGDLQDTDLTFTEIFEGITRKTREAVLDHGVPGYVDLYVLRGHVIDAGGGQVGIMVARDTMNYPPLGARVELRVLSVPDNDPDRPVMCVTMGHERRPAEGDAWNGEEDSEGRAPYCGSCLGVLGTDYDAQRWEGSHA